MRKRARILLGKTGLQSVILPNVDLRDHPMEIRESPERGIKSKLEHLETGQ